MYRIRHGVLAGFLIIALMGAFVFSVQGQAASGAQLRFVHALPGAGAVDIYVNGTLAITELPYGEATSYLAVPAGQHSLSVSPSGQTNPLWQQEVSLNERGAKTLIVSSISPLQFAEFTEDLNPLAVGKARFTAVHAIADAPAVDVILADGRPVVPGLAYNVPYGTLDLPALSYDLAIVPSGAALSEAIAPAESYSLNSGTSYIVVAYGTSAEPAVMVLSAPTRPETPEAGWLKIAHLIPDAADVDVFLNDTLVAPLLGQTESTVFMRVAPGTYTVAVRAPGAQDALASQTVDVTSSAATILTITGTSQEGRIEPLAVDVSSISSTSSQLTLINLASEGSVSASLADGTTLTGDLMTGAVESVVVQPSTDDIIVSVTGPNGEFSAPLGLEPLYGGNLYFVAAVNGAEGPEAVVLESSAIAQSVDSAPAGAAPATPATEVPPPPTATPVPATQVAQAVAPTATPAVVVNPEPTLVPTSAGPTARISLNAGANLHLRQYPSSEAFSLGLAPSGATMLVLGRAGAPEPPPGATPDPDAEEFVDPAEELEEGEDLDPGSTWLNVAYPTEDGGTVVAWVNALYLVVQDARGFQQRLADLPTVPSNRPGETLNTSIQPPSPPDRTIFAFTGNVAAGARVHIRRTPDIAGESLALVPGNVRLTFLGLTEDQDWYFVRYEDANAIVSGWISALYVTSFEQLGRTVDLERIESNQELVTLTGEERGSVETFVAPTSGIPESIRDVVVGEVFNLNPGINLHLRRFDDSTAESLALLPGGTIVTVDAQSEDGLWLRVTYDGTVGWVSSEYVRLTLNGEAFDIIELPVAIARPLPTNTPEGEIGG